MSHTTWTPRLLPLSQHEARPSGYLLLNGQEVAHTRQCCHCAAHFVSIKGSGHIRGYCTRCNSITCGDPGCDVHLPWERRLELTEQAARGKLILPGQY